MELFKAHNQWSKRPADERFASLEDLYTQTHAYAQAAKTATVPFESLRVEAEDGAIMLAGKQSRASLTHWAFGQLCQRVAAPASYLRELPATLAAQNLNHGLAQRVKDATGSALAKLLFHQNGGLLLRALTSDEYSRIWNFEVAERLLDLKAQGWDGARPTTAWGKDPTVCIMCNGDLCQYCKGTGKALPALYASDHDMFAFVMRRDRPIAESGTNGGGLYRGVIVENSEVGASALRFTRFLFDEMCGNHIIWGAQNVTEISIRHIGDARDRWHVAAVRMREYAEESTSDLDAIIKSAKQRVIAATKEQVLDALFGKRSVGISRKTLEAGYTANQPEIDNDPHTVWGMVQGLTRHSQTLTHADARNELDRKAGALLEIEF